MKIKNILITMGLLGIISGCATTQQVIEYPTFSDSIKIHASKETVSTWTETPANDALMPESQVFVAKKSGGFSLLGGALGIAIQRSSAKSKASGASGDLSIYFDDLVEKKLLSINGISRISIVESDGDIDFKLLPSIRFEIDKQQKAALSVRLTSRYITSTKKPQTKDYFLYFDEKYALEGNQGWFGDSNQFKSSVDIAFEKLVTTFYEDITGELSAANDTTLKRAKMLFDGAKKAVDVVVIKANENYSTIALMFRGTPYTKSIFIVPTSKVTY